MSEWEETAARLRERADLGYPDAWIPKEPGEELLGVVASVRPAVQTSYGAVPVVELVDAVGAPWSVWLVHTVLRNEFLRQRPRLGERVLIRYLGTARPESGGAPYESYRLVVDRVDENTDVDWTGIATRYADPGSEPAQAASAPYRGDSPLPRSDDEIPY
jgi:hypothetical protein